ncbi:MAG: hypothetical protein Kow0058_10860 [Roseovarius sp.]
MGWQRFPVPHFDYRALKGLEHVAPQPVSAQREQELLEAARAGDPAALGAHAVQADARLLQRLSVSGEATQLILCVLPPAGGHVLGRSMAWYNQRAFFLDSNAPEADPFMTWRTPRTHNTRLGPEEGVDLARSHFYLLSGRITEGGTIGNRVMIDADWRPDADAGAQQGEQGARGGCRILCACDRGEPNFHDSCFMISWAI